MLFLINTLAYFIDGYGWFCYAESEEDRTRVPRNSPYRIVLTKVEEQELKRRASKYTLPYFEVQRAKMVLMAAEGMTNDSIGVALGMRREVVSLGRKRFFQDRLRGLEEHPRPGRPRSFSPSGRGVRKSRGV